MGYQPWLYNLPLWLRTTCGLAPPNYGYKIVCSDPPPSFYHTWSISRCKARALKGQVFSPEHPWRSFIWYMKPMIELAQMEGVQMASFSNCCFGGRREKWTTIITNCPALVEALNKPNCYCNPDRLETYQPYYDNEGQVRFPTEEEAEYPAHLCAAYAQALKRHFADSNLLPDNAAFRVDQVALELEKYSRFSDDELKMKVAHRVVEMESKLAAGKEKEALIDLLANGHYRGTDIRLFVEHHTHREMVPYPAYRWLWRETLAFKWRQDAHINELETQALIAHIRRLAREPDVRQTRLMVIIDSQVLFYALGKGRSPSKRLNRLLRRLMALSIFADLYVFPAWTLSSWNWANHPSRRQWCLCGLLGSSPEPCKATNGPF